MHDDHELTYGRAKDQTRGQNPKAKTRNQFDLIPILGIKIAVFVEIFGTALDEQKAKCVERISGHYHLLWSMRAPAKLPPAECNILQ